MSELNLDYLNAVPLIFPTDGEIRLHLVGCGGTGSWLAPAVARVGKLLIEVFNKQVAIYFYDSDLVEEKNIYRQNFCAAEIGRNKAETLAERFGLTWGIEIIAVTKKFTSLDNAWGIKNIVIGCVDNSDARKAISQNLRKNVTWLDCGNTRNYGQILLGTGYEVTDPFAIKGFCGALPYPHEIHPELIKKTAGQKTRKEPELSCAEMALQDSQGLAINQRVAAEAADYLVRMLITKDLMKFATYIDLESGTTRSNYITEKVVKEYGKN